MNQHIQSNINILVTVDENYIPCLNVMLSSLIHSNPGQYFSVYLLHSSVQETALSETRRILGCHGDLTAIQVDDRMLDDAPTTSRYPKEIYYRIFAARYLPETVDRILYLDPDIIVNGSVADVYETPMEGYYFAAATHVRSFIRKFNELRLDMDEESPYINSGVMLMNLSLLRKEQNYADVFTFIGKYKKQLMLPDQDIISSLYGTRIHTLDAFRYNMTERLFMQHAPFDKDLNLKWVRDHSVIIHYCGRNKPWKDNYIGQLDIFYHQTVARMNETSA